MLIILCGAGGVKGFRKSSGVGFTAQLLADIEEIDKIVQFLDPSHHFPVRKIFRFKSRFDGRK